MLPTQNSAVKVIAQSRPYPLEPIGNHNRGTKFINGMPLLDDKLRNTMLGVLDSMSGVQFGRMDMKAQSLEDLREGKNFKILEFNGVNSEPAHIYDPSHGIWKAYADLSRHWRLIGKIAREQRQLGVQTKPVNESWEAFMNYWDYKKQATATA